MTRRRVVLGLKILVAAALCAFLVGRVDWGEAGATLRRARPELLVVVLAAMFANVWISALKWRVLLRIHGVHWPLRTLTAHYFIAMFVNNFLPTSIGGDGYRILSTLRNPRSRSAAVVAVFMERVTGIAALLLLGGLGAAMVAEEGDPDVGRWMLRVGAATALGVTVGAVLLAWPTLLYRVATAMRLPGRIHGVLDRLSEYRRHPVESATVVGLSFGFHLFSLGWLAVLLDALGGGCPLAELAVVQALTNLAALAPLSINGLGVQDGAFVFLAGRYGVPYETALFAAAGIRIFLIPISVVGGVLYAKRQAAGEATEKGPQEGVVD